jgi:hypothetical protein
MTDHKDNKWFAREHSTADHFKMANKKSLRSKLKLKKAIKLTPSFHHAPSI